MQGKWQNRGAQPATHCTTKHTAENKNNKEIPTARATRTVIGIKAATNDETTTAARLTLHNNKQKMN
jgi:hypothetical protein